MSLGYLTLILALLAAILSTSGNNPAGRARLRLDHGFQMVETEHIRDNGFFLVTDDDRFEDLRAIEIALIFERLDQISANYSTAQTLSIADLGVSNLIALAVNITIEVNGSGDGRILVSLPPGLEASSFVSRLNGLLGNQFAGIFDGADVVSDLGYTLTVPSGFSTLTNNDIVILTP